MRGANGILLIAIGLLVIWAVVAGAGPCLGGALKCFTGAGGGAKSPTISGVGVGSVHGTT